MYPTDYMALITNKVQRGVIDAFAKDLETSLGVALAKVSFNELWDSTAPSEAKGISLPDYMKDVSLSRR